MTDDDGGKKNLNGAASVLWDAVFGAETYNWSRAGTEGAKLKTAPIMASSPEAGVLALVVIELREQNKLLAAQNEILRDGIREIVGALRGRE